MMGQDRRQTMLNHSIPHVVEINSRNERIKGNRIPTLEEEPLYLLPVKAKPCPQGHVVLPNVCCLFAGLGRAHFFEG